MNKIRPYVILILLMLLILSGCSSNENDRSEDIFSYKGSYIGDNSAVINIIGQLKHSEEFNEVSLETKNEPYGMTIEYDEIDTELIENETKETALYNATFLFALIDNAEWVDFDFSDHHYKMRKKDLEDWYGEKLNTFRTEKELKGFVQDHLKDKDKVNKLFMK